MLAMGVVTPLGLAAQRWMTYELLDVDGGIATWCPAAAILVGMGLAAAQLTAFVSH